MDIVFLIQRLAGEREHELKTNLVRFTIDTRTAETAAETCASWFPFCYTTGQEYFHGILALKATEMTPKDMKIESVAFCDH